MSDETKYIASTMMRPSVVGMARTMEGKLRRHDLERGTEGWRGEDPEQLLEQLRHEVDELEEALVQDKPKYRIISEAADVANMAMMVADTGGEMESEAGPWSLVCDDSPTDTAKEPVAPAEAPVGDGMTAATEDPSEKISHQDRIDRLQQIREDALVGVARAGNEEIAEMALLAMEHLDALHGKNSWCVPRVAADAPAEAPVDDRVRTAAGRTDDKTYRQDAIAGFRQLRVDAQAGVARPLDQDEIAAMALLAGDHLDSLDGDEVLAAAMEAQINAGTELVVAARVSIESMTAADKAEDGAAADSAPGVSEFDWATERALLFTAAERFLEAAATRHCRNCLCTDEHGCRPSKPSPESCGWAEEDLCNRCADTIRDQLELATSTNKYESHTPTPSTPAPEPVTIYMPDETVTLLLGEGDPLITVIGNLPIEIGTAPGHITVRAVDLAPETREATQRFSQGDEVEITLDATVLRSADDGAYSVVAADVHLVVTASEIHERREAGEGEQPSNRFNVDLSIWRRKQ